MEKIIIWWSSWDFYRIDSTRNTDKQIKKYFTTPQASALEIMLIDNKNITCEISKEILDQNFKYCSIHAPANKYENDETSHQILKQLQDLYQKYPIQNIVIHPDEVIDRSIFKQHNDLPFSIENMDNNKNSCQWVQDLEKIFEENPQMKFTLDLQHAFVNDPTMQLAKDLHTAFGDRLVEYHISWFDKELLHYPLFKTEQTKIIDAIEKFDIPLIIESTFDNADELDKEIKYITQHIIYS